LQKLARNKTIHDVMVKTEHERAQRYTLPVVPLTAGAKEIPNRITERINKKPRVP
jgi:hypothetical protein